MADNRARKGHSWLFIVVCQSIKRNIFYFKGILFVFVSTGRNSMAAQRSAGTQMRHLGHLAWIKVVDRNRNQSPSRPIWAAALLKELTNSFYFPLVFGGFNFLLESIPTNSQNVRWCMIRDEVLSFFVLFVHHSSLVVILLESFNLKM